MFQPRPIRSGCGRIISPAPSNAYHWQPRFRRTLVKYGNNSARISGVRISLRPFVLNTRCTNIFDKDWAMGGFYRTLSGRISIQPHPQASGGEPIGASPTTWAETFRPYRASPRPPFRQVLRPAARPAVGNLRSGRIECRVSIHSESSKRNWGCGVAISRFQVWAEDAFASATALESP